MPDVKRSEGTEVTRRTLLAGAAVGAFAADTRIVDPHVHVWKHDPAFPFAEGAKVPDRDATPETLLGLMKANNVARTVIIQVIHYKYDNRYLASVLKKYPGTFQGVCRVHVYLTCRGGCPRPSKSPK